MNVTFPHLLILHLMAHKVTRSIQQQYKNKTFVYTKLVYSTLTSQSDYKCNIKFYSYGTNYESPLAHYKRFTTKPLSYHSFTIHSLITVNDTKNPQLTTHPMFPFTKDYKKNVISLHNSYKKTLFYYKNYKNITKQKRKYHAIS